MFVAQRSYGILDEPFLYFHMFKGVWNIRFASLGRKLEDKLLTSRVELRAFTLNLDLSEIHGNRELPSAFVCYLGVCDSTLPLKGTAHRTVRGAPPPDDRTNVFLCFHSNLLLLMLLLYGGVVSLCCGNF